MDVAGQKIILFDDHCILCNGTVQWILKYDKKAVFTFSSLQSKQAKKILSHFKQNEYTNSVLLIDNEKLYSRSTAALRIVRAIPYFKIFYILIIIPRAIRDLGYNWIARNRYKWFGKTENCLLPDEKWKNRFI